MEITAIPKINHEFMNKDVKTTGKVENIKKTSGPYLVFLEDQGAKIVVTTFTQPTFNAGDYVEVEGNVHMSYNGFQIRAKSMTLLDSPKVEVDFGGFIIKNEILSKLKDKFVLASEMILDAVQKQRPILLKHHNDADGYSGALALEEAIIDLIKKENGFTKWNLFTRGPSTTPFYDYFDATIDISNAISKGERFGTANPLLIIVDNGSSEADQTGINLVKAFGFDVIVVDHHNTIKNPKIDIEINPHLVDGDSNLTAGMMSVELAKMINPDFNNYYYACIACIGDRSNVGDYFPLVDIPVNTLKKMAIVIDFQAKFLRRMEARGLMQELLNMDKEHLDIIFGEVEGRLKKQVNLISMNFTKEDLANNANFLTLDYKKVQMFKDFPSIGTNAGLLINEFGDKHSVAVAYDEGITVVRASDDRFDFNELLAIVKENPKYGLKGGGHKKAGTFTFVGVYTDEILRQIKEYVSSLQA